VKKNEIIFNLCGFSKSKLLLVFATMTSTWKAAVNYIVNLTTCQYFAYENEEQMNKYLRELLTLESAIAATEEPDLEAVVHQSRVVYYRDIKNPIAEQCPISLEAFEPDNLVAQLKNCGHIFHKEVFDAWFQHNMRCPVCRYKIIRQESHWKQSDKIVFAPITSVEYVVKIYSKIF
jgi:hypothetical protein